MDEKTRRRVVEYVKPLAVGLDGTTYSGDVDRVVAASERIGEQLPGLDPDLLFLLAVFSGQDRWVQRMGHASRTEIFLSSLGVAGATIRALFRGLPRLRSGPVTPEEEVIHDAMALDEMGAHGIVRQLLDGYRERLELLEMAEGIERGAERALCTASAEGLARPRRQTMREFARRLREEYAEFGAASDKVGKDPG
ncbi:MAG TPA: hypothetical protein VK780_10800 [Thermoanaerobaculia bacterium]|nr:hypothetical protein [Thermoanaerobaculia bacterium]